MDDAHQGVECPMAGSVLAVHAQVGTRVRAGETLLVITAMKMETAVTAPCTGLLTDLTELKVGDTVSNGQVVALIRPQADDPAHDGLAPGAPAGAAESGWAPVLGEVAALQALAAQRLAPGSREPGVVRQRDRGKLNCRERIGLLLDEGRFREVGSLAGFASYDDEGAVADFTPANHVGGWGRIDGRTSVVCADDFTSRGGHADGAIGAKSGYLDRLSIELRVPSLRLLDGSSGGGSVAAMVPQQHKAEAGGAQERMGAIKAGRPRVTGAGGS
ncbi:MAG: hypothetical protein NTV19_00810, partial [Burkholderiales bacterium]|nr:hypothetical protein [Burkholderiales bacterium]